MTRALVASVAVLTAGAAQATTLCVHPTQSGCFRRIQEGVDAAQPGDLVQVGPGVYAENVVVPIGKDHVRIEGFGPAHTTVDPVPIHTGTAFTIFAPGVEVRGFRVRAGRTAVQTGLDATDVVIQGMRLLGSRLDSAIVVAGARTHVLDNEIRGAAESAVELIFGTVDCVVEGNRISQVRGGVEGQAVHRLEVRGNEIVSTNVAGVAVTGDDVQIVDNSIVDVSQRAIAVHGARPFVINNRMRHTGPSEVTCTTCGGGQVFGNRSHSLPTRQCCDAIGWNLTSETRGLRVVGNYVSRADAYGYLVQGAGTLLEDNRSIETGRGHGFWVMGRRHLLRGNSAIRSAGAGFYVTAEHTTLERNSSSEDRVSGFMIGQFGAFNTRLLDNVAARSRAAGFSVLPAAQATFLTRNRGAENRYDFCDDGIGTDVSGGNLFTTVSTVCDLAF